MHNMGSSIVIVALMVLSASAWGEAFEEREARMWSVEEFSLSNPGWRDAGETPAVPRRNPFDVVAKVTFTHEKETRKTEMFYAGGDHWKFRFTGTRTGRWEFTTVSEEPALDGHGGTVLVLPRLDKDVKGFLAHVNNKFAIMEEDADDLQGYVYQVYMNQQDFEQQYRHPSRILGAPDRTPLIPLYWDNTRDNGFDIYFFAIFYSWFRMGALSMDDFHGKEDPALDQPDLAVFAVLEKAIQYAHARGGRTHLWAWGDNDRKQTPNHLGGGFRGVRHKRLMRYIAARLGPLPGWSMNFGFDTIEMPNAEKDCAWWAGELSRMMGWPHMLTSRGWSGPAFGANSYAGFGGNPYDLKSSDKGPADYAEIRADLEAYPDKPSIYEERHTYNRWRCWPHAVDDPHRLDEDGCRRLIWWETMAGGMGGFFGHFSERFNAYGPFKPAGPCGYHPESLKQAFRTHRDFWRDGRLRFDMTPLDNRVQGAKGYCLTTKAKTHWVFFVQDADAVSLNLDGMPGEQQAILLDTRAPYREIDAGTLSAGVNTVNMNSVSDWAIAVGDW